MKLGQLINLISGALDQMCMVTDLKALRTLSSSVGFSKGGLSEVFKLPTSEFLRIVACALAIRKLMQSNSSNS